jgi:hypothetical protein
MSDPYNDPQFRHDIDREFRPASIWAALGALAIVAGMFVVLGMFAGPSTQTATNKPAVETTGSGGSAPPLPPRSRD